MTTKKPGMLDHSQMEMFGVEHSWQSGHSSLYVPDENLSHAATVSREYIGPAVDLTTREHHLQAVLSHFAQANQRAPIAAGFVSVRSNLEVRYGVHADEVAQGAVFNRERAEAKAEEEFRRAFGSFALCGAGIDERVVNGLLDYEDFRSRYAGTANSRSRDAYRRKLAKAERIRHGKPR